MKNKKSIILPKTGVYVALLVASVIAMLLLKLCSSEGAEANRVDRGSAGDTIDVAIEYSPMMTYMYDDTLGGFNYDVIRAVATDCGLVMKFHPITSVEDGMTNLENGIYDILIADVPATKEMQERFLISDPVILDRLVLVQHIDSLKRRSVEDQLQLAGKTVWVPKGSPVKQRLENMASEIGDTIYVKEHDMYGSEQLFLLVDVGDIPMAVVNERSAKRLMKDSRNVDISVKVSFTQFQSWMLRKDEQQLADSLNVVLKRYKDTGQYDKLLKRYQ